MGVIKSVSEGERRDGSRFSEEPVLVRVKRTVLTMLGSEMKERTEEKIDDEGPSSEGVRDGRDGKGRNWLGKKRGLGRTFQGSQETSDSCPDWQVFRYRVRCNFWHRCSETGSGAVFRQGDPGQG